MNVRPPSASPAPLEEECVVTVEVMAEVVACSVATSQVLFSSSIVTPVGCNVQLWQPIFTIQRGNKKYNQPSFLLYTQHMGSKSNS